MYDEPVQATPQQFITKCCRSCNQLLLRGYVWPRNGVAASLALSGPSDLDCRSLYTLAARPVRSLAAMKMQVPFMQLPLAFDAAALRAEIGAIGESAWRPHPQGYPVMTR